MYRSTASLVISGMLAAAVSPLFAQTLPSADPDSLAAHLKAHGIDAATGFRARRPITCTRGAHGSDSAYRCVAALADSARGGKIAALEIMIFNDRYDFAARDADVKAAVARFGGRWSLDYEPQMSLEGDGRTVSLKAKCHQSRGQANSPAYCLLAVARNVLVFTEVAPADASTTAITTSTNGGPESFDDMAHAGSLASLGAIAVANAQHTSDVINNASGALIR